MNKRFAMWAMVASAALASAATLIVQQVGAAGIPATGTLTYTGYLESPDGTAVSTAKNIALAVYDAVTAGNKVCEVNSAPITPVSGRFQIALPGGCTAQISANPELWIEVWVDGTSLGRTKLGAVPYAVEAGHAVTADSATTAANAVGGLATQIAGFANKSEVPVVTAWQSGATPVVMLTNANEAVTAATTTAKYRRVGDSAEVRISTTFAAPPTTGANYYHWTLPDGLVIDLAKVNGSTGSVGSGWVFATFAIRQSVTLDVYARTDHSVSATGENFWYINDTTPLAFDNGFGIALEFTVPIVGWTATQ
jgi:hypothetical protein